MIITAIADIPAQSIVNCAVKSIRPTGKVLLSVERVNWLASAYSFQDVRKAKIPAEATPDFANGNSIFQKPANACNRQPVLPQTSLSGFV